MIDNVLPGQLIQPGVVGQVKGPGTSRLPGQPLGQPATDGASFRQLLDDTLRTEGGVKFSAHAMKRLSSRGIQLGPGEVSRIEGAVDQAAAKGSRDSLLLGGEYALVVNVPSRTVITAFDQAGLRDNVVTNIDSAVLLSGPVGQGQ